MFDIVTFGSATRDLFIKSKDFKTLKHPSFITGQGLCFNLGSKIYIDGLFFATGGGGTNTATTFARQGFKTACVGKVGQDLGGKAIKEELKKLKITDWVVEDKKRTTAYSIILSVSKKERTILVYQGACHYLEEKEIPFNKLRTKWIYIAGLSGHSAKILVPIINFAKKNKIKVALNPGASQLALGLLGLKNILSVVDILIINQEEGARLTGLPYTKEKEIFKKLDKYVRGIVVMTKGPKGVIVSNGKYIFQAGTFKERRYEDRTGAGDAFGSGFVAAWIRTNKIEEAIRLGTANGTSIVEQLGAKNGILTKSEFLKDKRWKNLKITKSKL
jgi:sugar/nucleoside kinase (ribokinase family)